MRINLHNKFMHSRLRQKAVKLRVEKELSYGEIKKRLNVSKSTLSYWLRDFPLNEKKILELRRKGWTKSEASREKFRATMREKKKLKNQEIYKKYRKEFSALSKKTLFIAGVVLYLCEGTKTDYSRIVLTNTDPKVIKFFIWWMNIFLDIPKNKIKVALHLYEGMNLEKEFNFWKNGLEISKGQFFKTSVRKLRKSSFSYGESFRHGTCKIYFGDAGKKREIMMAIQAFFDSYK